jgi:hypothetical protein
MINSILYNYKQNLITIVYKNKVLKYINVYKCEFNWFIIVNRDLFTFV